MTNTLLIFDEQDKNLGDFFGQCQRDLESFFQKKNLEIELLNSRMLNNLAVQFKIEPFNNKPFIIGIFTHGDNQNLLRNGTTPFISTKDDLSQFKNSFFYTFSCKTGQELGKELIKSGCKCFIGYHETTAIWDSWKVPFIHTATYGVKLFYEGKSSKIILEEMLKEYDKEIDKLYKKDLVIASILMDNRDALVMYGDDVNLADFNL